MAESCHARLDLRREKRFDAHHLRRKAKFGRLDVNEARQRHAESGDLKKRMGLVKLRESCRQPREYGEARPALQQEEFIVEQIVSATGEQEGNRLTETLRRKRKDWLAESSARCH